VKSLFDARFNTMERDVVQQRELMARLVTDEKLRDPRAVEMVREALARSSTPVASSSAAAEVLRSASQPPFFVFSSSPVPRASRGRF